MKKLLWSCICLILCYLCIYLYRQIHSDPVAVIPPFPESPIVRVLLHRKTESASIHIPSKRLEVWIPKADRPYKIANHSLLVHRKDGAFHFLGIKHKVHQIELRPSDEKFSYLNGDYPGVLRLIAINDIQMAVVNLVEMEPYISRVVAGEMKSSWPLETLKAQAIAARSYTYYQIETRKKKHFDVYSTSLSQRYLAEPAPLLSKKATYDTLGLILKQNQQVIPAYYLNTCGGKTRSHTQRRLHFTSVDCHYCHESPYYSWTVTISHNNLQRAFKSWFGSSSTILDCRIEKDKDARVKYVIFSTSSQAEILIKAKAFRKVINRWFDRKEKIKSLMFDLSFQNNILVIEGLGWGFHGIGMCQYGSKKLGEEYLTCSEILGYYYPESYIDSYQK